jgi:hypothetical protein
MDKDFQNETRERFEILRREFLKIATQQKRLEDVTDIIIHFIVSVCMVNNITPDQISKRMMDGARQSEYWGKVLKSFLGKDTNTMNTTEKQTRASQTLKRKKM